MEKHFIKLKEAGVEKYIYVKPQDIRCLEWDAEDEVTRIGLIYDDDYDALEVEETPGEIFEACRETNMSSAQGNHISDTSDAYIRE